MQHARNTTPSGKGEYAVINMRKLHGDPHTAQDLAEAILAHPDAVEWCTAGTDGEFFLIKLKAPPCSTCYGEKFIEGKWEDGRMGPLPCPTCGDPANICPNDPRVARYSLALFVSVLTLWVWCWIGAPLVSKLSTPLKDYVFGSILGSGIFGLAYGLWGWKRVSKRLRANQLASLAPPNITGAPPC